MENYLAYGQRRLVQPGSERQSQWFHGKEQDSGTGLQYFGARYYDPVVGRFLGIDPVDFQEENLHSFNRYAYGNNNPTKYLDPDGNHPILALAAMALFLLDFHSAATSDAPFTGVGGGVAQAAKSTAGMSAKVAGGQAAAMGTLEGARYAQKTFSPMFSKGGAFAGKSVDDIAGALRSGAMKPSEVPIDFIVRDGNTLILNTRSAKALETAGC